MTARLRRRGRGLAPSAAPPAGAVSDGPCSPPAAAALRFAAATLPARFACSLKFAFAFAFVFVSGSCPLRPADVCLDLFFCALPFSACSRAADGAGAALASAGAAALSPLGPAPLGALPPAPAWA